MTPTQEALLRAAFLKVRDEGPTDYVVGVCYNVHDLVRGKGTPCPYHIVGTLAATWPELHPESALDEKGVHNYPIAGLRGRGGALWEGEQLRLRISLINHVLDHLDTYQA